MRYSGLGGKVVDRYREADQERDRTGEAGHSGQDCPATKEQIGLNEGSDRSAHDMESNKSDSGTYH